VPPNQESIDPPVRTDGSYLCALSDGTKQRVILDRLFGEVLTTELMTFEVTVAGFQAFVSRAMSYYAIQFS